MRTAGITTDIGLSTPRATVALRALSKAALTDSVFVEHLLEAVAKQAAEHTVAAELPASEREVWESVGARFDRPDAVAQAHARAAATFAELLAGSIVGDVAAARMLGVDRTRVSQKVSERSLFAVASGGERYFPLWQFVDGKPLRGLKEVLGALDEALHPLTVNHWFLTPNRELDLHGDAMSPVAWLATGGDTKATVRLAEDV